LLKGGRGKKKQEIHWDRALPLLGPLRTFEGEGVSDEKSRRCFSVGGERTTGTAPMGRVFVC